MELTYNGPDRSGVHVPIDGGVLFFPRGKAVDDVPDALAKRLLKEQPDDWSSTDRPPPKATKADKPDEGKE